MCIFEKKVCSPACNAILNIEREVKTVNILVIDVGTSSMRGILFRADGKKLKQHQVAYRPSYNTKGELEQSADEFVNVCMSDR